MPRTNKTVCKLCGKHLIKKVYWQEYCSKKCRHLAWAKRELKKAAFAVLLSMFLASPAYSTTQTASWYSYESCLREGTSGIMACGRRMVNSEFTCASWDYPLGTTLLVTADHGSVYVLVTDRGPNRRLHRSGRVLDLSPVAFQRLAPLSQGVVQINSVEVIK